VTALGGLLVERVVGAADGGLLRLGDLGEWTLGHRGALRVRIEYYSWMNNMQEGAVVGSLHEHGVRG
jgi:hypothetical protein